MHSIAHSTRSRFSDDALFVHLLYQCIAVGSLKENIPHFVWDDEGKRILGFKVAVHDCLVDRYMFALCSCVACWTGHCKPSWVWLQCVITQKQIFLAGCGILCQLAEHVQPKENGPDMALKLTSSLILKPGATLLTVDDWTSIKNTKKHFMMCAWRKTFMMQHKYFHATFVVNASRITCMSARLKGGLHNKVCPSTQSHVSKVHSKKIKSVLHSFVLSFSSKYTQI